MKNIHKAMQAVQLRAQAIGKSGAAQISYKSTAVRKYSTLIDVYASIKEILKEEGLLVIQEPLSIGNCVDSKSEVDNLDKKTGEITKITTNQSSPLLSMRTKIIHVESSEMFESTMDMPIGAGLDPQKYGSAVTYARRYHLMSLFGLVSDDDDGSLASFDRENEYIAEMQEAKTLDELKAVFGIAYTSTTGKVKTKIKIEYDKLKAKFEEPAPNFQPATTEVKEF